MTTIEEVVKNQKLAKTSSISLAESLTTEEQTKDLVVILEYVVSLQDYIRETFRENET